MTDGLTDKLVNFQLPQCQGKKERGNRRRNWDSQSMRLALRNSWIGCPWSYASTASATTNSLAFQTREREGLITYYSSMIQRVQIGINLVLCQGLDADVESFVGRITSFLTTTNESYIQFFVDSCSALPSSALSCGSSSKASTSSK